MLVVENEPPLIVVYAVRFIVQALGSDLYFESRDVLQKRFDQYGIILRTRARSDEFDRVGFGPSGPVWPGRAKSIERVRDRENACGERDTGALQAFRISVAVPKFVMVLDRRNYGIRKADLLEDRRSDRRMDLCLFHFSDGQLA